MKTAISLVFLVMICSCIQVAAQNVKIEMDKSFDLKDSRSFSVAEGDIVLVMRRVVPDSLLRASIRDRVIEVMEDRGYSHSADSTVGLRVTFVAEVVEKQEEAQLGPLGQQPADEPAQVDQAQTWVQVLNQSSLSIVISDAASGKKVWQSSTTTETASPDIREVLLTSATRSLRKLPRRK